MKTALKKNDFSQQRCSGGFHKTELQHTHTHTHRGLGFDHVIGPLSTAAEFHGGPRLFVEHDAEEEDERTLERDRDRERESERDRQRQRERERERVTPNTKSHFDSNQ